MLVLEELDADAVRRWSRAALAALQAHQAEIDALNVFPVPDADTGTNLVLTMAAADAALDELPAGSAAADAVATLARGAVTGARGNSGVIVSQLLRGMAEAARDCAAVDGDAVRRGLRLGAKQAQQAVAEPAEGTILTVAQAAADAVADDAGLGDCVRSALAAAETALALTVEQHPVLAEAGVVDAGARGYVLVLDALHEIVTGERREPTGGTAAPPPTAMREAGSSEFGYEVQYLLEGGPDADIEIESLRTELSSLGDSVVIAGTGDGTWNVHVHTNDVGAAVEAGVAVGRPHRISVVRFVDQVHSSVPSDGATGVVAVAPGIGLAHLFVHAGVQVVDGADPSVDDVLAVIRTAAASDVVLVPVGGDATPVAESAAATVRDGGARAIVVPTRSAVQALAAIAVHDAHRRFDDNVVAMAEAAAATRFAEITIADGDGLTSVGMCHEGDVLGLIDGEVVEIGRGMLAVVLSLIDRLLGVGAELLTVLVADDAPVGIGDHVARHVHARAPLTEVSVYPAGAASHPLVIGVE
ncbi:MAG TPA: DAK2 domain-containing protein [Jatrophihabitantaceae bacterium]|nr:DAK2 domain-containing protein [Jatrophihabitantaceae bacterium]